MGLGIFRFGVCMVQLNSWVLFFDGVSCLVWSSFFLCFIGMFVFYLFFGDLRV